MVLEKLMIDLLNVIDFIVAIHYVRAVGKIYENAKFIKTL